MPQPYNYTLRPSNPVDSMLKGMQMRSLVDQNQAKQVQAQEAAAQKKEMQQALGLLAENPTAEAIRATVIKYPALSKSYEPILESMSEVEKTSGLAIAQRVYSALKHKKKDVAIKILNDRADALENSGDVEGAKRSRAEAEFTDLNPRVAETGKGLLLYSAMGDDFDKFSKGPSDIAKTEAETTKIRAEGKKIEAEAKQIVDDKGKIPLDKRPEWTLKIANQYLKEGGEDFEKIDRAYENIKNASPTGAGGLNLIISFMKTIDPTSIVSGNEKATAENAPGWSSAMINTFNKVFSDGKLGATTIKQFKAEALKIRNNAKKRADKSKNRLGAFAKRMGLDIKDIFNPEDELPPLKTKNVPPPTNAPSGYTNPTGKP